MNNFAELKFIEKIADKSVNQLLDKLKNLSSISMEENKILQPEVNYFKKKFNDALLYSFHLSEKALKNKRKSKKRIWYFNTEMKKTRKSLEGLFPHAARAWVLDGIIIKKQTAGIKYLLGLDSQEGALIDVLNSASSIALGAENPWLLMMDRIEDFMGWKDNVCTAYHPGLRQVFAFEKLRDLYPIKKNRNNVYIHMESSASIVNSIAIETVNAYAEKVLRLRNARILAVDGTWAGGFGSAREATGFGVDVQEVRRLGKTIWVDRSLPPPTAKFHREFMTKLKEKIEKKLVAGLYLEPDILGDLGIIVTDKKLLIEVKHLMKKNRLPIIVDCVQQLGRTGSYWGENVDAIFSDFDLLVVTTAKSASNGQPFGMVMMPKTIEKEAYPFTQITTNQMNGPLLRVLLSAELLKSKNLQKWFKMKSDAIDQVAKEENFDKKNLLGKYLNRGIAVGNNNNAKLVQIALLIEDGVLVGALPNAIRYQPMLFELSETNKNIARIIFRRVNKVLGGNVSDEVKKIYNLMQRVTTGLAKKSTKL
ncbi:hypothetical protein A3B40_00250 [Candidatus Roizmanbacteria bacterium RIFCSPLOWO2_01_FULL_37_16]|uniref:Aminotransferase class III n=1 Tax=Candidatus Roizmanbacteria bacterium RIFCSPLOWO2_01_FULL_37_16 TaxID=1802058 RepID=A0A1F7IQG8_9BACT|nr:MAG: hypothetical protein A2859_03225 [Candidatus Roizmanbacteria bacterium RIFCSPHIGHO2_01_FULL_37_16b]OGK45610.1 MAG: hypothetical protein A3B40_00250 [Candidatus Roizmanbacteria bacterium RIFCSPLOWO2_01_FULL_37_16]